MCADSGYAILRESKIKPTGNFKNLRRNAYAAIALLQNTILSQDRIGEILSISSSRVSQIYTAAKFNGIKFTYGESEELKETIKQATKQRKESEMTTENPDERNKMFHKVYCCDCKWSRDGGGSGGTEEMDCDNKELWTKSFVTGKLVEKKCIDLNADGNCLGFESDKADTEIISEAGDSNE